jgi:hypothetical protein
VFFGRKKEGKKTVIDWEKLIVPATWDLASMEQKLERRAQFLKALPAGQTEMMVGEDLHEGEVPRSLVLCSRCVFNRTNSRANGYPIAWQGDDFELKIAASCPSFKELKLKSAAQ